MPVSKKVSKYPAHFFDLLNIRRELLPLRVECETRAKAQQRRLQLYGFTEALRNEGHPGAAILDSFVFTLEDTILVIGDRDVDSSAFAQAIANATVTPPSSGEIANATAPSPGLPSQHESVIETFLKGNKP